MFSVLSLEGPLETVHHTETKMDTNQLTLSKDVESCFLISLLPSPMHASSDLTSPSGSTLVTKAASELSGTVGTSLCDVISSVNTGKLLLKRIQIRFIHRSHQRKQELV